MPHLQGLLLILHWDPEDLSVTDGLRSQFPQLQVAHFCLQTASKRLREESSSNAPPGVRPARFVFTQLLRDDRTFDHETSLARDALTALLREATILVSLSLLPSRLDHTPKLSLIHLLSAGIDLIVDSPFYRQSTIPITTSKGIHGVLIAEWVAATLLSFRKNLTLAHVLQKRHEWPADKSAFSERGSLQAAKVGILGYGSIGRQVARILSAFGCNVVVMTASPRLDEHSRTDRGYMMPGTGDPHGSIPTEWFNGVDEPSLLEFLSQALDILVLSLPLTPTTENLISKQAFDTLSQHRSASKTGCFVVNISRGKIMDQSALVAALEDGRLAGAALDVTTPEPLPCHDQLWSAKNVTITPHISTLGPDYVARAVGVLSANLERLERGEALYNLVNRTKGY